jgi:hypothetical protein
VEIPLDAEKAVVCATGGRRYPVVEGIPVFVDEATLRADPQCAGQRSYFDSEFSRYDRYLLEHWRVSYLNRWRAAGLLAAATGCLETRALRRGSMQTSVVFTRA